MDEQIKLNDRSSIHIYWWMLNELNLSGSELLIYATIFSFTNGTKNHCYQWSAEYLWKRANVSRKQVTMSLKRLENKWLIFRKEKKINWVKFVDYYTNFTGWEETSQDMSQNFSSYNSIYNSNNISNTNVLDNISIAPKVQNKGSLLNMDPSELSTLGPLSPEADYFIKHSYHTFPSIKYQMDKNPQKYLEDLFKDYDKLCKEYGKETVDTVLNYIKQDDFWSKQIQSIGKLRKKNKDWVPYIVVMIEKIQQYKPKIIDLD